MSAEASNAPKEQPISEDLRKEAVDALAQLKGAEQHDTFDYFRSLLAFKKHAADPSGS